MFQDDWYIQRGKEICHFCHSYGSRCQNIPEVSKYEEMTFKSCGYVCSPIRKIAEDSCARFEIFISVMSIMIIVP